MRKKKRHYFCLKMTAQQHVHMSRKTFPQIQLRPCASHSTIAIQLVQPFSKYKSTYNHKQLYPSRVEATLTAWFNIAPVIFHPK